MTGRSLHRPVYGLKHVTPYALIRQGIFLSAPRPVPHGTFSVQSRLSNTPARFGADLDSTTVTKLEGHAELVADLVNSLLHIYSCQRRQLRTSRLSRLAVTRGCL